MRKLTICAVLMAFCQTTAFANQYDGGNFTCYDDFETDYHFGSDQVNNFTGDKKPYLKFYINPNTGYACHEYVGDETCSLSFMKAPVSKDYDKWVIRKGNHEEITLARDGMSFKHEFQNKNLSVKTTIGGHCTRVDYNPYAMH